MAYGAGARPWNINERMYGYGHILLAEGGDQMTQEKQAFSPFAALSYQEQQDRWLEWRSRQLDFKPAQEEHPESFTQEETKKEAAPAAYPQLREPPPVTLPYIRNPAPTRHHELDKLRARHAQAAKMAGKFWESVIETTPG